MGFNFDFGHSKRPKMHFLVFGPVKTDGDASIFKNNFFLIDLESLPIVTAFDEYESKSARCPYKGPAGQYVTLSVCLSVLH